MNYESNGKKNTAEQVWRLKLEQGACLQSGCQATQLPWIEQNETRQYRGGMTWVPSTQSLMVPDAYPYCNGLLICHKQHFSIFSRTSTHVHEPWYKNWYTGYRCSDKFPNSWLPSSCITLGICIAKYLATRCQPFQAVFSKRCTANICTVIIYIYIYILYIYIYMQVLYISPTLPQSRYWARWR